MSDCPYCDGSGYYGTPAEHCFKGNHPREILLKREEYPYMVGVVLDTSSEYCVDVAVYGVHAWTFDDEKKPQVEEVELLFTATVKWDGCSHVNFGEKDNQGYVHLCGREFWKDLGEVLLKTYDWAKTLIPKYDVAVAE